MSINAPSMAASGTGAPGGTLKDVRHPVIALDLDRDEDVRMEACRRDGKDTRVLKEVS
jgi:hypothetical protein